MNTVFTWKPTFLGDEAAFAPFLGEVGLASVLLAGMLGTWGLAGCDWDIGWGGCCCCRLPAFSAAFPFLLLSACASTCLPDIVSSSAEVMT